MNLKKKLDFLICQKSLFWAPFEQIPQNEHDTFSPNFGGENIHQENAIVTSSMSQPAGTPASTKHSFVGGGTPLHSKPRWKKTPGGGGMGVPWWLKQPESPPVMTAQRITQVCLPGKPYFIPSEPGMPREAPFTAKVNEAHPWRVAKGLPLDPS